MSTKWWPDVFRLWLSSILLAGLSACIDGKATFGDLTGGGSTSNGYAGCIDGFGLDATSINVNFQFPSSAKKINVYRNGAIVFSTTQTSVTSFVDQNLNEGVVYTYSCEAVIGSSTSVGTNFLHLSSLSTNPPTFGGILSATPISSSKIRLSWGPSSGVLAVKFNVYRALGTPASVSPAALFSSTPIAQIPVGNLQAIISGLGDELPYVFGVRACTGNNNCDTNVAVSGTMTPDGGAPTTVGVTAATVSSGNVLLTAPWLAGNGAVAARFIWRCIDPSPPSAFCNTYPTHYTNVSTVAVASPYTDVPSVLTVTGVSSQTAYSFVVQDQDAGNHSNANSSVITIDSGKTTLPIFAGVSGLVNIAPTENTLQAQWTAIKDETPAPGGDPVNGASYYAIFVTSIACDAASCPTPPPDACAQTVALATIPAVANAAMTYNFTGLAARTNYGVCVKAKDNAGNFSNTAFSLTRNTLDTSTPQFYELQSVAFDNSAQSLGLAWNPSMSSDVLEYHVEIWKNITPTSGNAAAIRADVSYAAFSFKHSAPDIAATGVTLSATQFPIANNDTVYAVVHACDNANPSFGTQNCTSEALTSAKNLFVGIVQPPTGFTGITSALTDNSANGKVTLGWSAPTSWNGYAGFNIYTVTNANVLTRITSCDCQNLDCSVPANRVTSCFVPGYPGTASSVIHPTAGRTLNWYVRGHDVVNNETAAVNPYASSQQARTGDASVPLYTSAFSGTYSTSSHVYSLTWSAASDNQYASAPDNALTYKLYRKAGSTFTDPTQPNLDGTLIATQLNTTGYAENATLLSQGTHYYYSSCAIDVALNRTCDGAVTHFLAPLTTPPVISNLRTARAPNLTTWNVTFDMSDIVIPQNSMYVEVRKCADPSGLSSCTSGIFKNGIGGSANFAITGTPTANVARQITFTDTGTADGSVHNYYRVTVYDSTDSSGNSASATIADLNPAPTVASVSPSVSGSADPNDSSDAAQTVTITGTNFISTGLGVTIGGQACTSVAWVDSSHLTCLTPIGQSAGPKNIVVTNFDSQSALLTNGFTYRTYCALYGSDSPYAGSGRASPPDGSPSNPYIVCSAGQLTRMSLAPNQIFKLKSDIDLTSVSTGIPIAMQSGFRIVGNGKTISNLTLSQAGNASLFTVAYSSSAVTSITNLNLSGFTVTSTSGCAAGLVCAPDIGSLTLDTVSVNNSMFSGSSYTAGLMGCINCGQRAGSFSGNNLNSTNTTINITGASAQGCGGLIGRYVPNNQTGFQLTNSSSAGTIRIKADYVQNVGGIIGQLDINSTSPFTNNSSTVAISTDPAVANSARTVGGLIANVNGPVTITSSTFAGSLAGALRVVGGILGFVNGAATIENTRFTGSISLAGPETSCDYNSCTHTGAVGGILGQNYFGTVTINKSYSTGSISSSFPDNCTMAAGIAAYACNSPISITNSYSTSNINVQSAQLASGIFGWVGYAGAGPTTIDRSYYGGHLSGGNLVTMGFYYNSNNNALVVTNSYYDTDTNFGVSSGLPSGPVGATTSAMSSSSTFGGFNFASPPAIWVMPGGTCVNGSKPYPLLVGSTPGC